VINDGRQLSSKLFRYKPNQAMLLIADSVRVGDIISALQGMPASASLAVAQSPLSPKLMMGLSGKLCDALQQFSPLTSLAEVAEAIEEDIAEVL
jgi:hypothetical protein